MMLDTDNSSQLEHLHVAKRQSKTRWKCTLTSTKRYVFPSISALCTKLTYLLDFNKLKPLVKALCEAVCGRSEGQIEVDQEVLRTKIRFEQAYKTYKEQGGNPVEIGLAGARATQGREYGGSNGS
jgi:hypothetical protein